MYLHTLNGKPARFDGEQIIYTSRRRVPLARSLVQIRRERRVSAAFRRRIGCTEFDKRHLIRVGYVRAR